MGCPDYSNGRCMFKNITPGQNTIDYFCLSSTNFWENCGHRKNLSGVYSGTGGGYSGKSDPSDDKFVGGCIIAIVVIIVIGVAYIAC